MRRGRRGAQQKTLQERDVGGLDLRQIGGGRGGGGRKYPCSCGNLSGSRSRLQRGNERGTLSSEDRYLVDGTYRQVGEEKIKK